MRGWQQAPFEKTYERITAVCTAYEEACIEQDCDPLILIPVFVLDFICGHPFNDGNECLGRILLLLMLYRSGYMVGKYVSIEKLTERSKAIYFEIFRKSAMYWEEGNNDYAPFVRYILKLAVKKSIDQLELLKKSLMQKYFG